MTDLLEQMPAIEPEDWREPAVTSPPPATPPATERGHWVLSALLAGGGAIHLAMVPPHLAETTADGVGFVLAGLAQLGLAVWVAVRPKRLALWLAIAASLACIGGWTVSRTVGLPYGEGAVEPATFVDQACVLLEALAVLVAALLLVRRGGVLLRSSAVAVVGVIGALALTGGALASPSARDHAGHSHGDGAAAAGHDHGAGITAGIGAEDDLGFAALANGQMGSHEHPGQGDTPAAADLDPVTAGRLASQLALTAPLVEAYPTLDDALDAGMSRQGPFSPGLGLHVGGGILSGANLDGDMDPPDIAAPILIYDGTTGDAPLAGFMYMAYQGSAPEGFAGPLDKWHFHTSVCMVIGPRGIETPFGADLTGVTDEMCEAEGGNMIDFTGYMVHVWTVPGYESPLGTFSDLNPKITCTDGTYYVVPTDQIGSRGSTCRNANA